VSESTWYFLDSDRKQQGPVAASVLREAQRAGRINEATLVWRDGLSEWRPLAQLAGELGLSAPPPPSPNADDGDAAASAFVADPATAPRAPAGDVVYAGFLRRWAALFLDSLIIAIPLAILAAVVAIPMGLTRAGDDSAIFAQGVYYLLYLIAAPLYYAGMESSAQQATLGKRALGIKVTDNEGRRLSFGHALGRWFAAALSYLTLYIGFLMAAFTERKRALHDIVAGTLVVDRWAYSEFPERQKRELSGCVIAFLIGVLLIPFAVAVLAAIAIAQFEEYKIRAQVSEGAAIADGVKTAVAEYRMSNDAFPTSNAAAGLAAPESINGTYVGRVDVGAAPGEITVVFASSPPHAANPAIDGASLRFSPSERNGGVEWRCHSDDIKRKWCPRACECR
jgi:uncharacterized RDD family membrane protein YckC/Tfp pilus assembly major pilin PilA